MTGKLVLAESRGTLFFQHGSWLSPQWVIRDQCGSYSAFNDSLGSHKLPLLPQYFWSQRVSPDSLWERTTQGHKYNRQRSLGAILKVDFYTFFPNSSYHVIPIQYDKCSGIKFFILEFDFPSRKLNFPEYHSPKI